MGTCEPLRLVVEARDHAHLVQAIVNAHRTILELAAEVGQVAELFKAARWPPPRATRPGVTPVPAFQLVVTPARGLGTLIPVRAVELALRVQGYSPHGESRLWTLLRHPARPFPVLLPSGGRMDEVTAFTALRHAGMSAEALDAFRGTVGRG